MSNWDGFDMHAQLHPGFVPDACVAEVPGRPKAPRSALTLMRCFSSHLVVFFGFLDDV